MYVDLVIVRHRGTDTSPYIFMAPHFTHLEEGDMVEVETCKGTSEAVVLGSCTVAEDSEYYKCFSLMAKMKPFKRVLKVYKATNLVYGEETKD